MSKIKHRTECVNWIPAVKIPPAKCHGAGNVGAIWYAHCTRGHVYAYDNECFKCLDGVRR